MKKSFKVFLLGMVVVFAFNLLAVAKSDKAKSNPNSEKDKKEVIEKFKDFEKPGNGKINADVYKEKNGEVLNGLSEVAEKEKNQGQQKKEENTVRSQVNNPESGTQQTERTKRSGEEIAEELEQIAEESEEVENETVESMKKIENQNGFKKFLIGTDYKNLGQLRSSLVHNENQVRQLTRISEELKGEEEKEALQEQLMALMQERERIKTIITENEEEFSLLGWVFRLMNGYPRDSINENEEAELKDEVAEVLIEDKGNEEIEEEEIDKETEAEASLLQ
jgi:hypothetical protein